MRSLLWTVVLLALAVGAARGDWAEWRGPNRTGVSPDTGLIDSIPEMKPRLLWKNSAVGDGFTSVSVAGESVYLGGSHGDQSAVYCLDLKDGKQKWMTDIGPLYKNNYGDGPRATPTIHDGKLYTMTGHGVVACLDAASGKLIWSKTMQSFGGRTPTWGYSESVLIYDNKAIITPGGSKVFVALDPKTGNTVWASSGFSARTHYSSCIAVTYQGVPMIINGTGDGIFAVSPKDGKLLWSNPFCARNTANCPTPAYEDGYVFWANGYGKGGICLKLSVSGGKVEAKEAWKTDEMVCHHGGYVIINGYIYGNHSNGWACLDLKTGKKMWYERGVGKGSLTAADGKLFMFGEQGGRFGMAPATPDKFELKGQFQVSGKGPSWPHPVITGGRLFLRYSNNLYCFNIKK